MAMKVRRRYIVIGVLALALALLGLLWLSAGHIGAPWLCPVP